MKKVLFVSLFTAAVMLLLPLSIMKKSIPSILTTAIQNGETGQKEIKNGSTSFKVCNSESGEITEIDTQDYIFSVVAAEMPALYEEEALKAQAVAAYTFALSRKVENSDKTYDITTDHTVDQSYITEQQARDKWGDNADEYTEKIKKAIEEVSDYVITYDGNVITSVYHAISGGKTEDSKNVWGISLPYLKPVSSEGDKLSSDYKTEVSFTTEEMKEKLSDEFEPADSDENFFSDIKRTDSGTVTGIKVCGKEITGARLRSILDLRSSNFEVNYSDGKYTFTVYGYGHCVGMSQNGANYMAKQGSDFKEILTHYYTGCKIEKLK